MRGNEKQFKETRLIIVLLAVIIILLFGIIILLLARGDKPTPVLEPNKVEKKEKQEEKEKNTIYGYLAAFNDNESRIIELNTINDNKELARTDGRIYSFRINNNKLYYSYQNDLETAAYIDLASNDKKEIELISGKDVVDYYFDSNEKYLFASSLNGIKRYDLKTKELKEYSYDIRTNEVYIVNNKVYFNGQKKINNNSVSEDFYNYTIDFDGNDLKEINKEEYENQKDKLNNYEVINDYNEMFLIYNNKRISITKDLSSILYDNKEIYKADAGKEIHLKYSLDNKKIGFVEFNNNGEETGDIKYYTYDINSKKINEVNNNELYDLSFISIID